VLVAVTKGIWVVKLCSDQTVHHGYWLTQIDLSNGHIMDVIVIFYRRISDYLILQFRESLLLSWTYWLFTNAVYFLIFVRTATFAVGFVKRSSRDRDSRKGPRKPYKYWDVAPIGFETMTPMEYKALQGNWQTADISCRVVLFNQSRLNKLLQLRLVFWEVNFWDLWCRFSQSFLPGCHISNSVKSIEGTVTEITSNNSDLQADQQTPI